jgi:hypothetical protein
LGGHGDSEGEKGRGGERGSPAVGGGARGRPAVGRGRDVGRWLEEGRGHDTQRW